MNYLDDARGKPKVILHLCADIGSDTLPYREAGYDVRCIGRYIGVENYQPPENVYGIIANPPCTMFSIARSVAKTNRDLEDGMRLVKECLRIIWQCQYKVDKHTPQSLLKFWVIENPATGYLKHFLGNPAFEYCPSEFGEMYTKKTALWGYFNKPIKPLMMGKLPPGNSLVGDKTSIIGTVNNIDRMNDRSKVSPLFAKLFFEVNQ